MQRCRCSEELQEIRASALQLGRAKVYRKSSLNADLSPCCAAVPPQVYKYEEVLRVLPPAADDPMLVAQAKAKAAAAAAESKEEADTALEDYGAEAGFDLDF